MNKLFTKVAALSVGLAMAIGVGVGLGSNGALRAKATDVVDTLTAAGFAATNTTYKDFSGVTFSSDAVYAGNSAKTSSGGIQLRSKNSNSGIVTTASGGTLKSISITVESGSATVDVYGKTSPYTDATDLYSSSTQGTKIGSRSTTGAISLTNPGNYSYVGIRSNNGALYLTNIVITWDDGQGGETYSVTYDANATANVDSTNLPSPHTGLDDGATQSLSATGPTRWGYTFSGWATTAGGTTPVNSVTIDGADVTVYAIWTANLTVTGAHASNPYTVAQARAAIDAGGHLDENYVSGKISQIDSYNSTYHSITYWISVDGTTTNQLQVYSGKGLNNADFSTQTDIEVGATVVVCGTLKKYSSTYEFDKNNYQVSYTAPVITVTHDVTFVLNGGSGSAPTLEVGDGMTFIFPNPGTKASYNFKGWSSDNSTFYQAGNTSPAITADVEYQAYWQTEGTSADPYTVSEARAAIDANTGLVGAHVSGIVSHIGTYDGTNKKLTYSISDDGTTTDQLEVYKGKGVNNADFESASDIEVGGTTVVYGTLKLYNNTKYEFDDGNYQISYVAPVPVTVVSIEITGSLTTTSYTTSDQWSPAGLTVTATLSNSTTEDVTSSVTWSYSPASPLVMGEGTGSLTITATYSGETDNTSETVTVTASSYINTSGLVPGTYYIKYGSHYFTGTVASGKGSSSTTKPESTDAQFTFTLVGNDTWTVVNGSSKYLTIGSTSTSLGLSNSSSTLEVEAGTSGTYKIKGSSGRYVAWYESNSDFRTYSTGSLEMTLESVSATTYTITYNSNGGEGTMSPTVGTSPIVAACAFTAPTGKEFSKWNTASDGSGTDYAVGTSASSDITLYAIWVNAVERLTITAAYLQINSEITEETSLEATDGLAYTVAPSSGQKVKGQAASGDNKFSSEQAVLFGKNGAFIKNTDSFEKPIDSFKVFNNGTGSSSVVVAIEFGTSEITDTLTGGTTLDTTDHVFDFSPSDSSTDYTYFKIQVTSNHNAQIQIQITFKDDTPTYTAAMFAADFLETLSTGEDAVCVADGSTSVVTLAAAWGDLADLFDDLSDADKLIFKNETSSETDIVNAIALYDYVAGKYNTQLGNDYDFMDRNPAIINGARIAIFGQNGVDTDTTLIIVIASIVAVAAVGGYFFLRRKKEQ